MDTAKVHISLVSIADKANKTVLKYEGEITLEQAGKILVAVGEWKREEERRLERLAATT